MLTKHFCSGVDVMPCCFVLSGSVFFYGTMRLSEPIRSVRVIKKSLPSITVWHHKVRKRAQIRNYRLMTNGDREGLIFLSHHNANNGLFFLLTIQYPIFIP